MSFNEILIAVGVLCGISVIIGIALSIAEKVFHVEVNILSAKICEELPGINCGGCGFAGCDSCAEAISKGEAPVSACPVGGEKVANKIAAIMGKDAEPMQRKVAYVKCDGSCEKRQTDYNYYGLKTCTYAATMPDSSYYACKFGCLGYGSCAEVCDHNAIKVEDGKAVVDESLCIACGKCLKVCPHGLIELIPADSKVRVQCSSADKGKTVRNACTSGCLGCGICARNCPNDAIILDNNLAKIDYFKCTKCGICAEKCPRNIIKHY